MRLWHAILAGSTAGAAAALLATIDHFVPVPMSLGDAIELWDIWLVDGLVMGAFVGAFLWMLRAPRQRLRFEARCLIGINLIAWAWFLVFTPLVPEETYRETARLRSLPNPGLGTTDQPTVMAGRPFGGWGTSPASTEYVYRMTGPVATKIEIRTLPGLYVATGPTRRESYVIAGLTFLVSTSMWTALGGALAWLRGQAWKRRSDDGGEDVSTRRHGGHGDTQR